MLLALAESSDSHGLCGLQLEELEAMTGLGRQTIRKSLESLEQMGVLQRPVALLGNGSSRYMMNAEALLQRSLEVERSAASKKAPDSMVREIYLAYPLHKAPRRAYSAIESAIARIRTGNDRPEDLPEDEEWPPASPEQWLLDRTRLYAKTRGKRPYTPHPATWYNAAGYAEPASSWEEGFTTDRCNVNGEHQSSAVEEYLSGGYLE